MNIWRLTPDHALPRYVREVTQRYEYDFCLEFSGACPYGMATVFEGAANDQCNHYSFPGERAWVVLIEREEPHMGIAGPSIREITTRLYCRKHAIIT